MRFPEFQGEWRCITLGECSESLDYGMNSSAIDYDGENKYIRITDIDEKSSKYISDAPVSPAGELNEKYLVQENDILFARTGASTGKTYIYDKQDGKLYFAGFLIRAKIKTEYNPTFIFAQTQTIRYDKWVKLMSMRSGQPGINSQEYASFKISLPCIQEQEKIAHFLSLIDQRIETQMKIIEELKKLKTALVDGLYNVSKSKNPLRFPEYKNDWYHLTYGDIFNISNTRNTDYSIDRILSASQTLGMIERAEINIDIKFDQKSTQSYKVVKPGDYIIHLRSFQGGFAFSEKEGICSPAYTILKPLNILIYGFLKDYFLSDKFIKTLRLVTYGIRDGRSINVDEFLKLPILIPSLEEQSKIKNILITLECKFLNESNIYSCLKRQKQYLLEYMFI